MLQNKNINTSPHPHQAHDILNSSGGSSGNNNNKDNNWIAQTNRGEGELNKTEFSRWLS